MTADAHLAADFYASARGAVTARIVRERLAALWPAAHGENVLGLGYSTPYLRLWRDQATRCIALTLAQLGAAHWAGGVANMSCTAEEDLLPFADLTFDRILLVHGLENAENARRLLREAWRVLKDDGAAADRGAKPQRHVGVLGRHAVRAWPALLHGPAWTPAGSRLVPGGAA